MAATLDGTTLRGDGAPSYADYLAAAHDRKRRSGPRWCRDVSFDDGFAEDR